MDNIYKEAKRLHGLGFAIIWLMPKEKRPVGSAWTSGPRKSWEELKAEYKIGYNVGVRTGTPSRLHNGLYLAVIDVDIKDPKYKKIAEEKLAELITVETPEVRSGSGNGSRHIYCCTLQPFKMITFAKEEGWEICIYSDGRQMVLAPSIHPNGKPYVWKNPLEDNLPLLNFSHLESVSKKKEPKKQGKKEDSLAQPDFVIDESLDVRWLPMDEKTRSLIVRGAWKGKKVEDRSSYLLTATTGLISAGLDRNGVLTVLTDRTTYLGECAYDHAKTDSRKRAAAWLDSYTVSKVMDERSAVRAFKGVPIERMKELSEEDTKAQEEELIVRSEDNGFYMKGARGALVPDYDCLMRYFESEKPFKMIADMKFVFVFNGTHYEDITPPEIKSFAERNFIPPPSDRMRMEFLNKIMCNNVRRRNFFSDTIEGKLNFKNGVLEIAKEGYELKTHSPEFGFRGVLPYDFDPEAKCPTFKKWIEEVMMGDKELVAILQEFMGYVVRGGEYKYHKALWLGGAGRNGKSTFVDVLKSLIGPDNFSVISIKSLVGDKFAGAVLDGKIANFSEETSPQELADSGPFKNITGDGEIFAQKKFGSPYNFRNRAKLIMTYNVIPDLKDLSTGMLSRPLIVPFNRTFKEEEQDREIGKKLAKELPGIFNFALEGWYRLEAQNGFTNSEKSKLALRKVKEESCNVFQWVENHIEEIEQDFYAEEMPEVLYRPQELYDIYTKHEKYAFKSVEFYRRLNTHPLMKKAWKRQRQGIVYKDIKIR